MLASIVSGVEGACFSVQNSVAGGLTTIILSMKIYFEQNLAKLRTIYPSKILGFMV